MQEFDVLVIGGGPGGYVAAIRAAKNGAKTALVERKEFGGTCLNIGCIPTKTLIAGVDVYHKARHAMEFGVKISGEVSPDWEAMLARKDSVIKTLRGGIGSLLKAAGVTVFKGHGAFTGRKTVKVVDGEGGEVEEITANKIIIASGSETLVPGFIPKGKRVITSTELLSIPEIPKSLLILGGGVIGCEFACLFAELGTKVTIVEMLDSIMPNIDRETSRVVAAQMQKMGIEIMNGKPLGDLKADDKGVSGKVGDLTVSADYLLVSIGRKPALEGMNLAASGVKTNERGWIPVDSSCRTNVPGIFAIGDATGSWQLAHAASAMGVVAADVACGKKNAFDGSLVPGCIFTSPEIGSVGKSQEQCDKEGIETRVGKFPFAALGKAMAINETVGFCKIIADAKTDQILGVHIVGPHATDLIAEACPALHLEITAKELGKAIHAHPTLGEAMMEAAHAVHGESAHIPSKRR
ncbi:MAG TPA: dihydrolipoyl dehydrogenase [Lentisphaeria bacterium]|mgnify:FL=1|nr:dihydrolipoyl dehydrogenase [Lentisphaeria bacterium]HCG24811.1 dihydrolipoyl dehydrogenase [Lentisphaeria bacterium]HCG47854.1 dihydrolipoyl dehydrogenase [Lentisphaeria bacterium]